MKLRCVLPIIEQRRLSEALAKLAEIRLVLPNHSEKATKDGQQLAAEIRAELAQVGTSTMLDETMQQLRGRLWLL